MSSLKAFQHRALLGWLSEFSRRPLPGPWPDAALDAAMQSDLEAYFDLCIESGYTEIILWGLFVERRWPVDIVSACLPDKRVRIEALIAGAHARNLKIICGVGLYTWGYDAIIEAHPHLSRTNSQAFCPSVPESHEWVRRILTFLLDDFDFDGLNMQSADLGRCHCPECSELSDVAYHVRLNREAARHVRTFRPDSRLIMDNWGVSFADPADLPHLVALSEDVDGINDYDGSAKTVGREYRRTLTAALHCPYGTLAGRSLWPPQHWPRDKWFLPTALTNVAILRDLYADGGRSVEQFATCLANPGDEITLHFMGRLMANVGADPVALMESAVEAVYGVQDGQTRNALAQVVLGAEAAYFANANRTLGDGDLFFVDAGFLLQEEKPSPETYLRDMTPEGRNAYGAEMTWLAEKFDRLSPALQNRDTADATTRCFANVLADVRRWQKEQAR